MMSEIFYWVLNISIIGSVTGIIVLGLRRVKMLPRFVVYLLWTVPLIRLWIPFGIANPYSLLNFISKFTTRTVVIWDGNPEVTMTNTIMGAKSYFPIVYKTNLLEGILDVASILWVIVAAGAVIASIMLYLITKKELRSAELIRNNIYKSDKIRTPAVYGIISARIIIPAAMAEGDIEYIILHEQVHIRRRDNLFRVIAIITACVHWFNPLTWVFLKYFFEDMELACDAKVLKKLDEIQVKEYATTILECASGKNVFASAFGGAAARVRIENILSYKKLTLFSSVCFAALVVAIVAALMTNAAV